jgi:hypothetical protein
MMLAVMKMFTATPCHERQLCLLQARATVLGNPLLARI